MEEQGHERDTNLNDLKPNTHAHGADVVLSGAEVLLRVLVDQGVDVIFGYPGGAVLPIYDALFRQNAVRHILVRHEQAAVHAAEAYARSTGKVGVVLVTSGPGATNAVTGLVDALMDSIPVVCFTGQVGVPLIGTDAFQEADTTGITRQATKHNYLVKNPADLARVAHEAFTSPAAAAPARWWWTCRRTSRWGRRPMPRHRARRIRPTARRASRSARRWCVRWRR
jgi:acetolactate synthase-1/2/3 large subunit